MCHPRCIQARFLCYPELSCAWLHVCPPCRGLHCYSALAAFRTRTCYTNIRGDQWVGWANGSLRPEPALPLHLMEPHVLRAACGVVHEEPARCGLPQPIAGSVLDGASAVAAEGSVPGKESQHNATGPQHTTAATPDASTAQRAQPPTLVHTIDLPVSAATGTSGMTPAAASTTTASHQHKAAAGAGAGAGSNRQRALDDARVHFILSRLCTMSWRRFDVAFGADGPFSGVPHNKIQGRGARPSPGSKAVTEHMASLLHNLMHAPATL